MTADTIPGALARACRAVNPAGPRDAIGGVMPAWVAAPASVEETSAVLAAATEHGLAVVTRGGGTKLAWGAPPQRCDLVIDTLRLDRVLEHAAGDLVARVQAGVTMEHLAGVLAAKGQQLAVDFPAGAGSLAGRATVGGTLATGAAGPRRLRYGTPRDLLIGITVVRADGTVAKSGGKVVKNVAGYDLGKLYAGSYGTLGVITDAVFRLHPLPAAVAYVTAAFTVAAEATAAVAAVAACDLAPVAIEIDRPARHGLVRVGVLLEGDPSGVAERAAAIRDTLGAGTAASQDPPDWWGAPISAQPGRGGRSAGAMVIRIAFWAAALAAVLEAVDGAASAAGLDPAVGGSAAAGVLHAVVPPAAKPQAAASFLDKLRTALAGRLTPDAAVDGPPAMASAVVLDAPDGVRDLIDPWGPAPALSLMTALKDQFDPGHLMAPGRFAGGI